MIRIIIDEPDSYYYHGMTNLLRELFLLEYEQDVSCSQSMSELNVWKSDIIIIPLCQGEAYTCKTEFKYRNNAVVIGLTSSTVNLNKELPLCYQDIVCISRKSSRKQMYAKIVQAWNNKQIHSYYPPGYSCTDCEYKSFSHREFLFLHCMLAGKPITEISRILNISEKTVYAYKYQLMKKFQLENKMDFFNFLKYLEKRGFLEKTQDQIILRNTIPPVNTDVLNLK